MARTPTEREQLAAGMADLQDAAEAASEAPAPLLTVEQVQQLVDTALSAQRAELLALIPAAAEATVQQSGGDGDFARQLAMHIAQLTTQGTGKQAPVDPAVMVRRQAAVQRMLALIEDARLSGQKPIYRLRHKVYLSEILIEPLYLEGKETKNTELAWIGIPNPAMVPHNAVAAAIYAAFEESNGTLPDMEGNATMKLTPSGVVIVSGRAPVQTSSQNTVQRGQVDDGNGLEIRGRGMPGKTVERRILGTVAAPARQMA